MELLRADLDGELYYADFGGEGPSVVLVHGLSGSHAHWLGVGHQLTRYGHVLAPDLVGFGRSAPAGRSCTVEANQRILDRFITEIAGGEAILFGNSMGGLISMLEAARTPERVRRLVLVDPAGPAGLRAAFTSLGGLLRMVAMWSPGGKAILHHQLSTMTPEHRVRRLLRLLCVNADRVDPDLVQALIEVAREQRGRAWVASSFIEAMRSIPQLWLPGRFNEIVDRITIPTLLIHGAGDPVVPVAGSEHLARRRQDWTYFALPGVGHTPQLEAPEQFLRVVTAWLDQ